MSEPLERDGAPETFRLRPPAADAAQDRSRKRELLAEQQEDWEAGRPVPPEAYLSRWPSDPRTDPDAASLIVAEFFRRREQGERPSLQEYQRRFPEHGPALAGMILHQDIIRTLGGKRKKADHLLSLPGSGEKLFGFRLRQAIGSGTFAKVFLAEQPELADRAVVLKISAIEGSEPQTLARLQHTNIVPIYSVHEDPRAGLRAVCMPYFGGTNLARVLGHLWENSGRPTRGAPLVAALEAVGLPPPEGPTAEARATLAHLRGLTYVQAVAWTVARLAEGLHHAHQRGVLHRDLKPSNILLAADGEPLLLDFNVSQDAAADAAAAILGGTVAYAAPEHLEALRERTPEAFERVDRRSDLYALGLILYEMLTGRRPFEQAGSYSARPTQLDAMAVERGKGAPSPRQARPDIPWGLESIARKCLDPDPGRRYQQADHLADDLRRLLEERPLRHAPELSWAERGRKFLRRHPRLTTSGSVALAATLVLLAVGTAALGLRAHLVEARAHLAEARAWDRKRAHDAGTVQAQCLVNTTLGSADHLRTGIDVCERTLALYDLPDGRPIEAHPDWRALPEAERRGLAEDHRELLLLLAGARVRLAPGDRPTLHGALALLDRAAAIRGLGPSKALWLDRADYRRRLGQEQEARAARLAADQVRPSGARDHYLLAISHAREGGVEGFRRAIAELDEALRLNPRHYWSMMQRGICRIELGEDSLAVGDFGACTGLWPEHPWGYFNRGYALSRLGKTAEAVADYSAALDRDPGLAAAWANRGLALLESRRHEAALADFDEALALGWGEAAVHAGRGIALEALGRSDEADAAFGEAFRRVNAGANPTRLRLRWTYGFAVAARSPEAARAAFDDVLGYVPEHSQALYGRAMLAKNGGQLDASLPFFERALRADPGLTVARRARAVLQARRGDWEGASRDINACLEREPESGETLYAAACVAARAAERRHDPRARDQALDFLRRSLARGAGRGARDDPDLAALRQDPRFLALVSHPPQHGAAEGPVPGTDARPGHGPDDLE
jgi:serine/threonine protein kinase/tetratricopeptide (TPR) repeat protein